MKTSEPLISINDVEMNFGGKSLFIDLSLHIYRQDRICLIGKNGEGKSTLMQLLCGLKEPTRGKVWSMPGLKVGYLSQSMDAPKDMSVKEYVFNGLEKDNRLDYNEYMLDMVTAPLSLDKSWLLGNMSGGQIRRASLARSLIMQPDLLLLDEPTNHLDISAIEWLEGFIASFEGAVMTISHDRRFLANVSRSTIWLDRGVLRTNDSGYKDFEDWSLRILEQEQRELNNLHRRLQEENDWLHGGVTARRKRNQRRLQDLYAMREKLSAARTSIKQATAKIQLDTLKPELSSKLVAEFKGVNKSYGDKKIIEDFSYRVIRGDKIGIVGKNGSGKSTFLKMLVGQLAPDSGSIKLGKTLQPTYFDQARADLDPDKTLWETLCPNGGDRVMVAGKAMHVVAYLKKFLFDPKLAQAKVGILSGGQANRLLLAKALGDPGNVLILDEPTNDLDMDTLDLIEEILSDFSGTLLLVSHDRDFLDRVIGKTLVFEGNTVINEYLGGYSDYLAYSRGKASAHKHYRHKVKPTSIEKPNAPPEKLSYNLMKELEDLPEMISSVQEEIAFCEEILADVTLYSEDPQQFLSVSEKLAVLQERLAESELRWLHLTLMKEGSK